jgi:hypothetical protein
MRLAKVKYGDFFERRGRKGFAKGAKEVKEKEYKIEKEKRIFSKETSTFRKILFFGFTFGPSFLRPLRNLCVLCVQKLPFSPAITTTQTTGSAIQ